MKIVVAGKREMLRMPIIALAAVVLVGGFVLLFSRIGGGGDSAVGGDADFESSAVIGALDSFGALSTQHAVEVWSEGVASRNCAEQYAVICDALREKYLEVIGDKLMLESTAASVDSWYLSEVTENDGVTTAKLLFTISDGDGETTTASAELTLEQEGDYTVVSSVAVESPLYEFTGISA